MVLFRCLVTCTSAASLRSAAALTAKHARLCRIQFRQQKLKCLNLGIPNFGALDCRSNFLTGVKLFDIKKNDPEKMTR